MLHSAFVTVTCSVQLTNWKVWEWEDQARKGPGLRRGPRPVRAQRNHLSAVTSRQHLPSPVRPQG